MSRVSGRANERGSALLIVFVFAAALAIMLYREMPVVAFEAQRQKEQLLVDRGNEYKRAVKLYVRKFQTFPAAIEALENTNRMRFLRNRYVDPFSGKADWRFLHAGPGGIIIDSKIKSKTNGLNGALAGSNSTTAASTASGTNASATSTDPSALLNAQAATANPFPQRPPAVGIDAGTGQTATGSPMPGIAQGQAADGQPTPPIPTAGAPYAGYPGPPVVGIPGMPTQTLIGPDGNPLPVSRPGRFRNTNLAGDPNAAGYAGAPATGNSQDPQSTMQALVNNTNPQPTAQTGVLGGQPASATPGTTGGSFNNPSSQSNNTLGGGIAGVASKVTGPTIKVINDQTDRGLWEFVYDMQKELAANAPGLTNGRGQNNGQAGTSPGGGTNASFNSPTTQTSTFGSGSSFGQPATPPASPQQAPSNQ